MKAAIKMAKEFQNRSKIAIQQAKLAINRGLDSGFQTGEAYEAQAFATCFATEDQKEAMRAFAIANIEICQISVARTVKRGEYSMLSAINPIFLIGGGGPGA